MSGLILALKRSDRAYYISESDIKIYSLEELQYYIYNNLYLVTESFFTPGLADYIINVLDLPVLGKKLEVMIKKGVSYKDMVSLVLSYGSYYTVGEVRDAEADMRETGDLSLAEKLKSKGDNLVRNNRYIQARKVYEALLSQLDKGSKNEDFVAAVWNNLGFTYMGLFLYEEGYYCYKMAADCKLSQPILDRLAISALLSENKELIEDVEKQYGVSLDDLDEYRVYIEKSIRKIRVEPKILNNFSDFKLRTKENMESYYSRVDAVIEEWKQSYREEVN